MDDGDVWRGGWTTTDQSHRTQETHSETKTLKTARSWGHGWREGGEVDGWMIIAKYSMIIP